MAKQTPFVESPKSEEEATWTIHLPIGAVAGSTKSDPADEPQEIEPEKAELEDEEDDA
jgi:hypothetical protein